MVIRETLPDVEWWLPPRKSPHSPSAELPGAARMVGYGVGTSGRGAWLHSHASRIEPTAVHMVLGAVLATSMMTVL